MKLATIRYEEKVGLEFTEEELYVLNLALSDFMILMQYCLEHNVEASPIVREGQEFDQMNIDRRSDVINNLKIGQYMKNVMELLVY